MTQPPRVIGIDAGATKTAGVAATADGRVTGRLLAGPSAVVGLPDRRCLETIVGMVDQLAEGRSVTRIVIGLSGVDFADELPEQHRVLSKALHLPTDRLLLVNDSVIALAGATGAARATMVQHGTEVTLAYRAAVGAEKVFDSLGVADSFDLRHRAVPLVARMIDGRAPVTALRDALLAHCGVAADRFSEWILRDPGARQAILQAAPVVFDCWQAGDEAAAMLVDRAVEDYALATVAMAARLGAGSFEACFGGGTIQLGGAALMAAIEKAVACLRTDASVTAPHSRPEDGALALAIQGLRDAA